MLAQRILMVGMVASCLALPSFAQARVNKATAAKVTQPVHQPTLTFKIDKNALVIHQGGLKAVTVKPFKGRLYAVTVTMQPAVAQQFQAMTKANVGKTIKVMVGKNLVSMAKIQSQLSSPFEMDGFTKAEAEQVKLLIK